MKYRVIRHREDALEFLETRKISLSAYGLFCWIYGRGETEIEEKITDSLDEEELWSIINDLINLQLIKEVEESPP